MNILIIGSKGFIGSHAIHYFQSKSYKVVGCDLVTDYQSADYLQIDASNADFLSLFDYLDFDLCINCSGAASVPQSIISPLRDFSLNTFNVFKLLEAIRIKRPQCKFINISSAAVYGNPTRIPIKETDVLNPISPYGLHKQMSETICREFYVHYSIPTCSLRIFSAYGERLYKQIFWDLSQKITKCPILKMFGNGDEARDFIHIDDILQSIELITQRANFEGEAINIGNGIEVSIEEAIYLATKICGWEGEVVFTGEARKGDPTRWQADISIIKDLGYHQKVSLEQGLKRYFQWVKENT